MKPLVSGETTSWRNSFYYEALSPSLGAKPLVALRNHDWKYVQTIEGEELAFDELYNLNKDPHEITNLAGSRDQAALKSELARELAELRASVGREEVV